MNLHPDLYRDLSQHCIARVSCYSILHDINKEAAALAAHDPLATVSEVMNSEKSCPLVLAATTGQIERSTNSNNSIDPLAIEQALIDEEKWLLATIADRKESIQPGAATKCPATFLQAMGEKDYENPVSAVTGHARTQLWKPSRSWWEAKSGKNPWIEPACHNKRWRYLWPLIHYHKFLAKCIKKLKRNGVDVKQSVSPVSVFLREEVCAVSDHLAAVSLFGSEAWMDCLQHFQGWTVAGGGAVEQYRAFVATLPLRPLAEPGDVDSPVLRDQIDQNFLRTMQAQREQLRDAPPPLSGNSSSKASRSRHNNNEASTEAAVSNGPPPMYPGRSPAAVPRQIHGVRRPRYYPNGWYGWDPSYGGDGGPPHDTSSVHSELSTNSSYPLDPNNNSNSHNHHHHHHPPPHMYPPPGYGYPPHHHPMYPPSTAASDNSHSTDGYSPHDPHHHHYGGGWVDPAMAYAMQQHLYYQQQQQQYHQQQTPMSSPYQPSSSQQEPVAVSPDEADQQQTPFKYDPDNTNMNLTSPYWSHLDQATLAMGLATPAKFSPSTPRRHSNDTLTEQENEDDDDAAAVVHGGEGDFAVAPLIRQPYYGYDTVPPSPATQFMMSPQSSFAYNYGYGFSPRRRSVGHGRGSYHKSSSSSSNSPATPLKLQEARKSPSTVETASETLEQPTAL